MAKLVDMLDLGEEPQDVKPHDQRKSVAFLLGAGFSIPMGYPTGVAVNKNILDFVNQPVAFSPAGEMCTGIDGKIPDFGYENNYDKEYSLCKELIAAYNRKVAEFDYEQFMDVLRSKNLYTDYAPIIDKYVSDTVTPYSLAGDLPDIYSQMVAHLLKDSNNKSWYEGLPNHIGPYLTGPRSSYIFI